MDQLRHKEQISDTKVHCPGYIYFNSISVAAVAYKTFPVKSLYDLPFDINFSYVGNKRKWIYLILKIECKLDSSVLKPLAVAIIISLLSIYYLKNTLYTAMGI